MDWFLYDNGPRHERVNSPLWKDNNDTTETKDFNLLSTNFTKWSNTQTIRRQIAALKG